MRRTKERDDGLKEFDRLEIYLADRLASEAASATVDTEPESFSALRDLIAALGNSSDAAAKEQIWDESLSVFAEAVATGHDAPQARRQLISLLSRSAAYLVRPDCSDVAEALRVSFHRKHERWKRDGQSMQAIADRRKFAKKGQPWEFTKEESDYLHMLAVRYNNTDLALREFLLSDKARPETKKFFAWNPSLRRLRTPKWLRSVLDPVRVTQQKFVRGPRTAKLQGAFTDRDPSTLASGDSDQSDDKTLDLYWWDDTPEGIWFGQGQLLVWIDERSWKILSFRLIADGAYSGFSVRNSWTAKAREWGLPRARIHVENGIWRSAKVFKGVEPRDNAWESVGTEETEMGLRRLGIRFRHATMPRGKLIERVFGSLTDLTMMLPGYAGRNQMIDRHEDAHQRALRAKPRPDASVREHPKDLGFLHRSQLVEHLDEIARKLNSTVKYGKYHQKSAGGKTIFLSPDDAYEEFFTEPLIKVPAQMEHLYRDNKIVKSVGANGILLNYGKRAFRYKCDAELGRLEGQKVVLWFNPEDPSAISVMRPNGIDSFAVPLESQMPDNATNEALSAGARSSATFQSYQREVSRTLKPVFRAEMQCRLFRYPIVESTAIETSQTMEKHRAQVKAQQHTEASTARTVRRAAERLQMVPTPEAMRNPDSARALNDLAKFMEDDSREGDER